MAPERPRREPQVFPKSHFPQRRFAYFAAAGKVGRRRSGETLPLPPQAAKLPIIKSSLFLWKQPNFQCVTNTEENL